MATNNSDNRSSPVPVNEGGFGTTSLTAYSVLTAGTTATGNVQTVGSVGNSGDYLTSQGASALPLFVPSAINGVAMGGISGFWYPSGSIYGGLGTTATSRSRATGTLYYHPIFVTKTTIFTNIGILEGALPPAGTSVLGLYNDSGNGKPTGSPIANSNSTSITNVASTFLTYTFSNAITLTPGIYWTAHSTSGTANFVTTSSSGSELGGRGLGITGNPASGLPAVTQVGWTQSFTYSATLPSVGTLTATISNSISDIHVFLQAQ